MVLSGSPSRYFECNPSPLLSAELWSSLDQWARTPPPRAPLCPWLVASLSYGYSPHWFPCLCLGASIFAWTTFINMLHVYIEGRRFFEDLVWHYSWLLARTYSDGVAAILFAGHLLYYPAWALRRHNAARHDEATSYFATANTAHDGTNAGLIFSVYVNLFDCTTW